MIQKKSRKSKNNKYSNLNRISKFSLIFLRFLYKPALALVALQIIVGGILIYNKRQVVRQNLTSYILTDVLNTIYYKDYIEYLKDLALVLLNNEQLPRLDLSINFKDQQEIECLRKRLENCTKDGWVRGPKIFIDNEVYKVKLKAKGDRNFHRTNFKNMSFKVDIRGDKRINGLEEFSLQSPVMRNYAIEPLLAKIFRKQGVISPRHYYYRFYINGEYAGLRHLEEGIGTELIEANKRRYGPVFSVNEDITLRSFEEPFELSNKSKWDQSNLGIDRTAFSILKQSSLSITRQSEINTEIFNTYFDIDLWAKYLAISDIFKVYHSAVPKNVKFYFNPVKGLMEPIFFDGHYLPGEFDDFLFSDLLNNDIDKSKCPYGCTNKPFWQMMIGNKEKINKDFFLKYRKYIELYSSEEFINSVIRSEWKKLSKLRGNIYRNGYRKDQTDHYGILPHVEPFYRILNRIRSINSFVRESKTLIPEHSYDKSNNILGVVNKESRHPQLYSIYCRDKKIISDIILPRGVFYKFELSQYPNKCSDKTFEFSIDQGNKRYNFKDIIFSDLEFDNKLMRSINNTLDEKSSLRKKDYIFSSKIKSISENLTIDNKQVLFENGTDICFKNNSFLHIKNSTIKIKGTDKIPIKIKSCNNSTGSIIFENSKINLNYLSLNSLSSPEINTRNLYGGLNIINSDMKANKLDVQDSKSEDAVNFINSNINIDRLD